MELFCEIGPDVEDEPAEPLLFTKLTDDDLRTFCSRTDNGRANWGQWTREMMLAFCHNRWPSGVVPDDQPTT